MSETMQMAAIVGLVAVMAVLIYVVVRHVVTEEQRARKK